MYKARNWLKILQEEGISSFFRRLIGRILNIFYISLYQARFWLTKPPGAKVIKIDDVQIDSSGLRAGEDALAQYDPEDDSRDNIPVTHQDRVRQAVHWHNIFLAEREKLVEAGRENFTGRSVLFILPVNTAGGGSNSVFLAARAMQKMGVDARIMNLSANRPSFEKNYPNVDVPLIFGEIQDIPNLAAQFNAVVATSNMSVAWTEPVADRHPGKVIGYYVQDYEPYFYPPDSEGYRKAAASYTIIPEQVRCVTTQWIYDQIQLHHGLHCHLVGGHIDTDLFNPRPLDGTPDPGRLTRIVAMIRPTSPRRSPRMTMEILQQAHKTYGDRLEFFLFGCNPGDPGFATLPKNFPWQLAGELRPSQVANLLNQSDIFVDFSSFQALGLTAIESMCCGLATIVPAKGGTGTFARHEENCLVVDTADQAECFRALQRLVEDDALRNKIQRKAISTGMQFSPELPAYNMLKALFPLV